PQPAPNSSPPTTSGLSICVARGRCIAPPRKLCVRFLAMAKANRPTAMAPPMTKASDGSQVPKRSRKPSTLAGSVMPERIRPRPKMRPTMNSRMRCCMSAASGEQVPDNKDHREAGPHEGQRGDQRAWGEARQPAYAVAAGAASPVARADADQQAGEHQQAPA